MTSHLHSWLFHCYCCPVLRSVHLKVPYHKKTCFLWSLHIRISWSCLSLPTPRMRKTSESCMVSAAHPLVKLHSYRLFRLCSFRYVMKGVIIIGQRPLSGDRRYQRGGHSSPRWSSVCPAERQQCFAKLSLRARHANCSVVGCINQHMCLYSVSATEQQ